MAIEFRHPVEVELLEKHLLMLEAMASKTRTSVSDIARELLEDLLTQIEKEKTRWVA